MTASKQGAESSVTCAFMQALMRPSPGGTPGQSRSTSAAQALAITMVSWLLTTAPADGGGSALPDVSCEWHPASASMPNAKASFGTPRLDNLLLMITSPSAQLDGRLSGA